MEEGPLQQRIAAFLDGNVYAVAGASEDRRKYGNTVLRCYMQAGRRVHPVNPYARQIEGLKAYADLLALPEVVHGVSIVTPPSVTLRIVRDAVKLGVQHLWMQPGAESAEAVAVARDAGISVIAGDACILVVLGHPA